MARLSLALLGGFQARLESGSPLALPTKKAQALLAYLAIPLGRAHPRDKLATLLWSGIREGATPRTGVGGTGEAARTSAEGQGCGGGGADSVEAAFARPAPGGGAPNIDAALRRAGAAGHGVTAVPALRGCAPARAGLGTRARDQGDLSGDPAAAPDPGGDST